MVLTDYFQVTLSNTYCCCSWSTKSEQRWNYSVLYFLFITETEQYKADLYL